MSDDIAHIAAEQKAMAQRDEDMAHAALNWIFREPEFHAYRMDDDRTKIVFASGKVVVTENPRRSISEYRREQAMARLERLKPRRAD